jgi:hypothetical protein
MKFSVSGSQEDEVLTLWSHQTPLSGCPTPPAKLDIFTPIRGQRNIERSRYSKKYVEQCFKDPKLCWQIVTNHLEETGCE